MKNKILRIFLAFAVVFPLFTSVFAASTNGVLAKIDKMQKDITDMKQEYNDAIAAYLDVLDELSANSKELAMNLADNLQTDLGTLKEELTDSANANAAKVMEAIEKLEARESEVIKYSNEVGMAFVEEYQNLTTEEIKQAATKMAQITTALGVTADVTELYGELMEILEEAHGLALDINIRLNAIIANNVNTFESALTKELLSKLLTETKNKDREAVIDALIDALDNASGGVALKANLKEVKDIAVDLKDTLMKLNDVNEIGLLMFTDAQKAEVQKKLKAIEKDYIDFAKVILDDYIIDYMDVAINLVYDESIDEMIEYANEALDYYDEYKDTVISINKESAMEKLALPEELLGKAYLMYAMGFVDASGYNKEYIQTNFGAQIENLTKYVANELVEYIEHIDVVITGEVDDTYKSGADAANVQKDLRTITASRFNTLNAIKELKERVYTTFLQDSEDLKADIDEVAKYVYEMYNQNILYSMEATMYKENDKASRKYEYNSMDMYVVTNQFMATSDFTAELGIPSSYADVLKYASLANSKIKTGSELTVTLSDTSIGIYTFAVLGDVFADGVINSRDYMVIKNYVMKGEAMNAITTIAADTFRDKVINSRDYMAIKNYVMSGKQIAL